MKCDGNAETQRKEKRKRIEQASCNFVEGRKEGREPCQGGEAGMQQEE